MSISEVFEDDHREIDEVLAGVDFSDAGSVAVRLDEFDRRLERHIVWEEEVLFPAAERVSPELENGPIAVMRAEHREIRALKSEARASLKRGDVSAARQRVRAMIDLLGSHNMKEERILYPACDRLLAGAASEAVLSAVAAGKTRAA